MRFFKNANYDFMKYRRYWVVVSLVLNLIGFVSVFVPGILDINVGIDFAGGTQLTLKFKEQPRIDEVRSLLGSAGLEAQIQRFGEAADNELLVRTPVVEGSEEGAREAVLTAISQRYNSEGAGKVDLNQVGRDAINKLLGLTEGQQPSVAESILGQRKNLGLISSWEQLANIEGMTPAILDQLKAGATLGNFSLLSVENVGPQIGKELRRKGTLAVVLSLLGMLIYIWIRFELRFGIGATIASLHDVLITLGLFGIFHYEFNLTTIAAFLTLVGYSVNDTVVIFDRVRENMRKHRTMPTIDVMNLSVNQTLSRTVLTSGTTFLSALALYLFGGDVIRGFAFIMTVGVLVGTYSSVFIACPFALLWENWFSADAKAKRRQDQLKKAS